MDDEPDVCPSLTPVRFQLSARCRAIEQRLNKDFFKPFRVRMNSLQRDFERQQHSASRCIQRTLFFADLTSFLIVKLCVLVPRQSNARRRTCLRLPRRAAGRRRVARARCLLFARENRRRSRDRREPQRDVAATSHLAPTQVFQLCQRQVASRHIRSFGC